MKTKYIREVAARYTTKRDELIGIKNPEDIQKYIIEKILLDNTKEHFFLFCLDGAHQVISYSTISMGTANQSLVHPREVFQIALLAGAVSIIVAHNHPSGEVQPSQEDTRVTTKLKEAANLLGIKFLDHIIVTETNWYSFRESSNILN